jgi:hypothetical protein
VEDKMGIERDELDWAGRDVDQAWAEDDNNPINDPPEASREATKATMLQAFRDANNPVLARDEDEYLERLIKLGLVIDDRGDKANDH